MKMLIAAALIAASVFTGSYANAQHNNRGYRQPQQGYGNQQQSHQQGGYGYNGNNNQPYNSRSQGYSYNNSGGYNQQYNNAWAQGRGQGYGHRRMMRSRYDRAMCRESFAMHMVTHRGGPRRW